MKTALIALALTFSFQVLAQTKATQKLFTAIEKNNIRKVLEAIEDGADVNGVDNERAPTTTAFLKAVKYNRKDIVKLLLEHKADVNQARMIDLYSGVMIAAKHDYPEMIQLLADHGADINESTITGRTALIIAALHNSYSAAQALLNHPAINVNARPSMCALMIAARQDHVKIVALLKKQKGDKSTAEPCLKKAIDVAEMNGNQESLEILKSF